MSNLIIFLSVYKDYKGLEAKCKIYETGIHLGYQEGSILENKIICTDKIHENRAGRVTYTAE